MPGAQKAPWHGKHGKAHGGTVSALAVKIGDYMAALPEAQDSISTRRMKADIGVKVSKDTWQRATAEWLATNPGWLLRGRSLVRGRTVFTT
jgi:hypothetical protein